jgi:hypothetical protein
MTSRICSSDWATPAASFVTPGKEAISQHLTVIPLALHGYLSVLYDKLGLR